MTSVALGHSFTIVRRRRPAHEPSKKATFQIRESLLLAARACAAEGAVPSVSALVELALEQKLRDLRRERLYAAYEEAANDPAFVREIEKTTRAFDESASDGLREPTKA